MIQTPNMRIVNRESADQHKNLKALAASSRAGASQEDLERQLDEVDIIEE